MSEPFIAEIRIFAGNFAPRNWAYCNGQQIPISQNTSLFSILGTVYGGDGRTAFNLPNLQGRVPIHAGTGPGLTPRSLGQTGGAETTTLTIAQMPAHSHTLQASEDDGDESIPLNRYLATTELGSSIYAPNASLVDMAATSIGSSGGGQAHNNMHPFLSLNFIIALAGLFPSRN